MTNVFFKEGFAPVVLDLDGLLDGLLMSLAKDVIASGIQNWALHYPTNASDIKNLFVLKHSLVEGALTRTVYIEFYRPIFVEGLAADKATVVAGTDPNYYYMDVRYGTGYTSPIDTDKDTDGNFTTPGTWAEDQGSVRSRFSWFRTDTESNVKKWLPVQYWMSLTEKRLIVVLAGDASANKLDRLLSFGYFGEIKPFLNDKGSDIANFAVSVGSDIPPDEVLTIEERNRFSDKTGTGVTDISMLRTYTGFPFQSHMAAFTTPDEFADKKLEGPSAYTGKYHMSPVYVFHGFDGYRGQLDGVIATDRSTVVNLDDLIHKFNATTNTEVDPDTQDIYKTFLINSPYSLLNNATNVIYGLAVLKESGPYIPVVVPTAVVSDILFTDTDSDQNQIGGTISWTAPADVTNVDSYEIYASTDGTHPAFKLGEVVVGTNSFAIPANTGIVGVTHLAIYTKNSAGRAATGVYMAITDVHA